MRALDGLTIGDSASGGVRLDETGTNERGIPRYTHRAFTAAERDLLRTAYGVDEPKLLYISDSSDAGVVKFDSKAKRCRACYVDTYRLGFHSVRRPEETWETFEKRMHGKHVKDFSPKARDIQQSLESLDPESRAAFSKLIEDGRRAGFRLSIGETYRTPEREALLFALGHGRTYTATSMHSYGRAVDIKVDDGRLGHRATRQDWVRFRQFVLAQSWGRFHLMGTADRTWDWPHIELASPSLGFHSIDDALAFAARCTRDSTRVRTPTASQPSGVVADPCEIVPDFTATRR
ncbi:MAG: hypothetical protein M3Y64_08345 [Gemmatimonadota bacterium]|nr:hypothetical protein [Gemmatimonadota bacterium]